MIESSLLVAANGIGILIDSDDEEMLSPFSWVVSNTESKFYAKAWMDGQYVYLHRYLLGIVDDPSLVGDHINGCTTDNRRCNLRSVSQLENVFTSKVKKNSETGVKGVSQNKNTGNYVVRIRIGGKRITVGTYPTVEEASEAYGKAFSNRLLLLSQGNSNS